MDSLSRKAWRIQEWRSSGFPAGPVARSHDYNNKSSKKNDDAILLYAQNLLHSCTRWENCEFVDRNFQLRFLVTIRRNAGQYGADRERARGVASSLWLQSQPRYSSRLVIRPCYNTSQLSASTREPREN